MSEKAKTSPSATILQDPLHKEIAGVLLGACGIYLALTLLSHHGGDPTMNNTFSPWRSLTSAANLALI
jgi:hypothetical protein